MANKRLIWLLIVGLVGLLFLPVWAGDEEKANLYSAKGVRAAEKGDLKEAKKQFQKALKRYPAHPGAVVALGQLLNQENDSAGLTELYSAWLKALKRIEPSSEQVKISEKLTADLVLLKELNKIDKRYSKKFMSLARSLRRKDEMAAAEVCLRALELDPNNSTAAKFYQKHSHLVAYWKFDETSGTTVEDSSGNKHEGKVHGARWVAGKVGGALSFDGTDDYIEAPAIEERSIVMWIKPGAREQMDFYGGGIWKQTDQAYAVAVYKPEILVGSPTFATTYGIYLIFWNNDIAIPYDRIKSGWHHIAVSWDGKVSVRISIDGEFPDGYIWAQSSWSAEQKQPFTLPRRPRPNANATTLIGKAGCHFHGLIDEVKIYDRALSVEEIKADYEKTK